MWPVVALSSCLVSLKLGHSDPGGCTPLLLSQYSERSEPPGGSCSHSQAYCPPPTAPIPRDPKFSGFSKPPCWPLQEEDTNPLTADNLEKFGKLSAAPGPPDDGTLLSEAKLQSIMTFLDEMEKSGQEWPAPWREVVGSQQREGVVHKAPVWQQQQSQSRVLNRSES